MNAQLRDPSLDLQNGSHVVNEPTIYNLLSEHLFQQQLPLISGLGFLNRQLRDPLHNNTVRTRGQVVWGFPD